MNASMHAGRVTRDPAEEQFLPLLRAAVAEIEADLARVAGG